MRLRVEMQVSYRLPAAARARAGSVERTRLPAIANGCGRPKKTPLTRGWPDRSSQGLYGELGLTGYRARNESMLTASVANAPRSSAVSFAVKGASLSFMSIPFTSSTLATGAACNRLRSMLRVNAVSSSQQMWNENGMNGRAPPDARCQPGAKRTYR